MNADQVRLDAAARDAAALVGGADQQFAEPTVPVRRSGFTGMTGPLIHEVVTLDGELVDERPRFPWQFAAALALAVGFAAGLLVAVALIPDQPDQVIVPVEAPAGFIAPETGEWSA